MKKKKDKVKKLQWVKVKSEPEYFWTKENGWSNKKDIPEEYWKIVEIGEE